MENEGGNREAAVGAPESVGEVDFGAAEVASAHESEGKLEKNEMSAAPAAETMLATLPPIVSVADDSDDVAGDDSAPVVERDAERMPKEYAKHLVEIIRKYKKEPNKLQKSVTSLKWDYMSKAFNRKLGDGLDGRVQK